MTFRFYARNALLTYPKCTLQKEEVRDALVSNHSPRYITVSRESHEDGSPHIHVLITWIQKKSISDARGFDIQGFHPNIVNSRNPKKALDYVRKHGDFIGTHEDTVSYGEILGQAESSEDFLRLVETHYPRDLVLNWERLTAFASARFKAVVKPYTPQVDIYRYLSIVKNLIK